MTATTRSAGRRLPRAVAVAGLLAALAVAWWHRDDLAGLPVLALLEEARSLGPGVFVALYALLSLLLVPTLPLNLAGGVLWGPLLGGVYSAAGATLGGAVAFLLARHLLGARTPERWREGRWAALREELARNDWKVLAFTRLSPVFPTAVLNYAYGMTPIRFATFLWSTLVFLLPGSIVFAGLGSLSGEIVLTGESRRLAEAFFAVATAVTALVALRWVLVRRVGGLARLAADEPAAAERGI